MLSLWVILSISVCIISIESIVTLQIGDYCDSPVKQHRKIRESTTNDSGEFNNQSSCDASIPLECVNGRCQCKRGYTVNRNGTRCLEIARNGIESPCEENIQCWKGLLGRLSECNASTGKCQCYESETLPIVLHQGRCYYGENLGDFCQIEGLCSTTTVNSICRAGVCQCREGFVPSWDRSKCLQIAINGLNSSCEENIQCEKSPLGTLSECNQETMRCQCYKIPMVPTVFHHGRCYFGASLGDVCQVSRQCEAKTPNSICGIDGKCRCNEIGGYVSNSLGSSCIPIISSDDSSKSECYEDIQCTRTLGHFSRCNTERRKCECFSPEDPPHSTQSRSKENISMMIIVGAKCYSAKRLGEECKFHSQCSTLTKNTICINDTCQCERETHVTSSDGRRCLSIATDGLGSRCEEDSQCKAILGTLSRCDPLNENCTCSNILPVVYYNKTCFFHRQLGTLCEDGSECKAAGNEFADCIQGKCQCENGTKIEDMACVPVTSDLRSHCIQPRPREALLLVSLLISTMYNFLQELNAWWCPTKSIGIFISKFFRANS